MYPVFLRGVKPAAMRPFSAASPSYTVKVFYDLPVSSSLLQIYNYMQVMLWLKYENIICRKYFGIEPSNVTLLEIYEEDVQLHSSPKLVGMITR